MSILNSSTLTVNNINASTMTGDEWSDFEDFQEDIFIGRDNPRLPTMRVGGMAFFNATGAGGTYSTVCVPNTGTYMVFAVSDTTSTVYSKASYSRKNVVYIGKFSNGASIGVTKLNAYHWFILFRLS